MPKLHFLKRRFSYVIKLSFLLFFLCDRRKGRPVLVRGTTSLIPSADDVAEEATISRKADVPVVDIRQKRKEDVSVIM